MTETPIALLQRAANLGLKLGVKPPNTLTVEPARLCPPDFAETLKAHKWALLPLLHCQSSSARNQERTSTRRFAERPHFS
jgi:hypothetical protein